MPIKLKPTFKTEHGISEDGEFCFMHWKADPLSPTGFSPTKLLVIQPRCKWRHCEISITRGEAVQPIFHWDGNAESPTITPSIGCDHRCGQHWHITNGEILP